MPRPLPPAEPPLAPACFVDLNRQVQLVSHFLAYDRRFHGTPIDQVHLHEVGAVDAILDVVGSIWGLSELGIERVYCGALRTGDGTVRAAHGLLPVPAPATLKLLEGHPIQPGPEGAGELVTPTGAALVRVLSAGPPPREYTPLASGFGAGTKDFPDRANALRIIVAAGEAPGRGIDMGADGGAAFGVPERLVMLAADLDDASPEYVAAVADRLRADGALDVVQLSVMMKKGRAGIRLEVLTDTPAADRLERRMPLRSFSKGMIQRVGVAHVEDGRSRHHEP